MKPCSAFVLMLMLMATPFAGASGQARDNPDSIVTVPEALQIRRDSPVAAPDTAQVTTAIPDEAAAEVESPAANFTVFGGVSLPVGAFGAMTGADGGAAKTGFTFGVDASVPFTPAASWFTSIDFSSNSMDLSTMFAGSGLAVESGSWRSVWALTGFQLSAYTTAGVQVFGFAQGGVLFGRAPEIKLSSGPNFATQGAASATALGFGFGAGVAFSHVSLGIRYVAGSPEYDVTATGTGGTVQGKVKQSTACVLISGGVAF